MIDNKSFINKMHFNKECNIVDIVRKLKNNEISIQSLDEKEKEEVYLFLKNEVLRKRSRLNSLKNRVLCNKAKYLGEKRKNVK